MVYIRHKANTDEVSIMNKKIVGVVLAIWSAFAVTSCLDKPTDSTSPGQPALVATDTVDLRSFVYSWVTEYADGTKDTNWTDSLRNYELKSSFDGQDGWGLYGPYKPSLEVCTVYSAEPGDNSCRDQVVDTLRGTDTIFVNYGPDSLYARSRRLDLPKPNESLSILPECSGKLFYATNSMDLGKFALKLLEAPAWLHLDSVPGKCSQGYLYELNTYEVDMRYFKIAPQSRLVQAQSTYLVVSEIPDSLGDSVVANWQVELTDRYGFKDTVEMVSTFIRR